MGRPAKQVDVDNAWKVCSYLRGHQDRWYNLGKDNYSKEYLDALRQHKFSEIIHEGIGTDYLIYGEQDKIEKSVPFLQKFLDSHMSNNDKTRMWKALRKNTVRSTYSFQTFQLTLDETSEGSFNNLKSDIISNIGFDAEAKVSNTDVIIGLMVFACKLKDKSIKEELLLEIETSQNQRRTETYSRSDLYKARRDACLTALIELGLDENQASRFTYAISLAAFEKKTIYELLNEKKDKPVPRYLAGLHKLREPKGNLHDLPHCDPKRKAYYELANWVVLPSDDVLERQLGLDV